MRSVVLEVEVRAKFLAQNLRLLIYPSLDPVPSVVPFVEISVGTCGVLVDESLRDPKPVRLNDHFAQVIVNPNIPKEEPYLGQAVPERLHPFSSVVVVLKIASSRDIECGVIDREPTFEEIQLYPLSVDASLGASGVLRTFPDRSRCPQAAARTASTPAVNGWKSRIHAQRLL